MSDHISPESMSEIIELIYKGQQISAVKCYKELRNVELLEAKQFIEQLTEKLKQESPEKFHNSSKSGCLGVLIVIAASTFAGWAALA